MPGPVLVIHGGAWDIPRAEVEAHIKGCRAAAQAGWDVLQGGGTAIDAVETAVRSMEDDGTFDAGCGSVLTADGEVELDAIIMDGRTLATGAVGAVKGVRNAVTLARKVMENGDHILLVGEGAQQFAKEVGLPLCDPLALITPREHERWEERKLSGKGYRGPAGVTEKKHQIDAIHRPMGTVGAVALDRDGNVAAATSTGGSTFKHAGRVGDSPIVGCGGYADNELAAISCTGWGEAIAKLVLAKTAADLVPSIGSQAAAERAMSMLASRVQGYGGIIVLSPKGVPGLAHNTPTMAWAVADGANGIRAAVSGR